MNIFAIIITYNPTLTDLQNAISSLLPQVKKIIIVDNGSTNIDDFSFPAKVELIKLNEKILLYNKKYCIFKFSLFLYFIFSKISTFYKSNFIYFGIYSFVKKTF